MLDPLGLVALAAHLQFQRANLQISVLLQLSELENQLFVVLGLVLEVGLQFGDAVLLLVLPLSQVFHLALVQVNKVLFGGGEFLSLTLLEVLDLS